MKNEKFFNNLTICKQIFQILDNLLKVFMSLIMSIATSQEIISEMKKNINIKRSNLDKVILKAIEDSRELDLHNIVIPRKGLELKDNYSNNLLVEIIIKLYINIYRNHVEMICSTVDENCELIQSIR